jgi:outer membrane lipoprotein-sorting protein
MRHILLFSILIFVAPLLQADQSTAEVIAKGREYLGGDEVLNALKSIRYEADFETAEGETGTLRIIFQKPMQQRVEVSRGGMGEVTALHDFDAWRRVFDREDASRWSMTLLDAKNIRELQANTWENLNFFQGIERRRGSMVNEGVVELDGLKTVKLVFKHPHGIEFTRFFDVETGRLVLTRTHEGAEISERGEIKVNGVVFPETLIMKKDGEILNQVHFRSITINEEFPDSMFEIPSLMP